MGYKPAYTSTGMGLYALPYKSLAYKKCILSYIGLKGYDTACIVNGAIKPSATDKTVFTAAAVTSAQRTISLDIAFRQRIPELHNGFVLTSLAILCVIVAQGILGSRHILYEINM